MLLRRYHKTEEVEVVKENTEEAPVETKEEKPKTTSKKK